MLLQPGGCDFVLCVLGVGGCGVYVCVCVCVCGEVEGRGGGGSVGVAVVSSQIKRLNKIKQILQCSFFCLFFVTKSNL